MVSMRNIGLLFINSMMFLCFMGLYGIGNAVSCLSSQALCCKGTTLSCCPHPGYGSDGTEKSYDLSACSSILPIDPDVPIIVKPVAECTSGQVQYQPKGDCGTSERLCCSDGTWSKWDGECGASSSCGLNKCWNGIACASKGSTSRNCSGNVTNATAGTQTRTATCNSGSGWSYGSWNGTCTCKTGYTWNSTSQTCGSKTCSGGDFYNASSDKCCNAGSYQFKVGTDGNSMHTNCAVEWLDVTGECCSMTNGAEFRLPTSAGSCSAFASKAGLSLNNRISEHACARL